MPLNQTKTLLHSLEGAAAGIGPHVNAHITEYMCYNQTGDISTLDGTSLKLVDKFTYRESSVSSTEKDIDTQLTKAWTAIDRLSIIWKSDLTDKMIRSFFQATVVSILLYGCTTWMLTKRLEKKLDSNYARMLRAMLNKSWRQHPTRHPLYDHLPPITKTIQARRTRHAGHCWRSRDELICDILLWLGKSRTTSSNIHAAAVRIRDVALKTCRKRWTIGRSGERGSGISVLAAWHDDDEFKTKPYFDMSWRLSRHVYTCTTFFNGTYTSILNFLANLQFITTNKIITKHIILDYITILGWGEKLIGWKNHIMI